MLNITTEIQELIFLTIEVHTMIKSI